MTIQIIRFFSESDDTKEFIAIDCKPTRTQDSSDVRQDHIDRLWTEDDRENKFDGVE